MTIFRIILGATLLATANLVAAQAVDKKSYFINHLFTKIIFPDQTLARTSAKVQKRQKLVHFGTLGLSAVGTWFLRTVSGNQKEAGFPTISSPTPTPERTTSARRK